MDTVGLDQGGTILRVEIHLADDQPRVFSSLAFAIAYLIAEQPIVYKLDVIEGDVISPLVSAVESEYAAKHPETGFGPQPEEVNVIDMHSRRPFR